MNFSTRNQQKTFHIFGNSGKQLNSSSSTKLEGINLDHQENWEAHFDHLGQELRKNCYHCSQEIVS